MELDLLVTVKQLKHDARLLTDNFDDLADRLMDLRLQSQLKDLEIEKLKAEIERVSRLEQNLTEKDDENERLKEELRDKMAQIKWLNEKVAELAKNLTRLEKESK